MDPESLAAVRHEVIMSVTGSIAVNILWWISVMVLGLAFPFMNFVLTFFLFTYLAILDGRRFPGEVSTEVYVWRACTNLAMFFIGILMIGPLGVLFNTSVPTGLLSLIMSTIAIATILALVRGGIIVLILIERVIK